MYWTYLFWLAWPFGVLFIPVLISLNFRCTIHTRFLIRPFGVLFILVLISLTFFTPLTCWVILVECDWVISRIKNIQHNVTFDLFFCKFLINFRRCMNVANKQSHHVQIGSSTSNWILMSCQPHRVTSGHSNSGHKQIHISKLFPRIYQPSVKSIYKTNHFTNMKHTHTNIRHKFSKS